MQNKIIEAMKDIRTRSEIPLFLMEAGLNKRICEVGVRFGYNLEQLLRCRPELVVAVDHYAVTDNPGQQDSGLKQDDLDALYRQVCLRFMSEPNVNIMRCTSECAAAAFPINWFDYIYLDDDHTLAGAYESMCNWWPRVRQGGIIAGHDYIDARAANGVSFGVIEAVHQFMEEKKIPAECFHHTREGYCSWMIYKADGE